MLYLLLLLSPAPPINAFSQSDAEYWLELFVNNDSTALKKKNKSLLKLFACTSTCKGESTVDRDKTSNFLKLFAFHRFIHSFQAESYLTTSLTVWAAETKKGEETTQMCPFSQSNFVKISTVIRKLSFPPERSAESW